MNQITEAKHLGGHKIEIFFSDGKHGVVDLKKLIEKDHRKIFQELTDEKKFQKFKVEMDTIVWENGLDLAPEFLYQMLKNTNS